MWNLDKITVRQFFGLNEVEANKYIQLQNVLNPRDELAGRKATPLTKLSFGKVSGIKRSFAAPTFDNMIEVMEVVYGVKRKALLRADIVAFFYAYNWVKKEVIELVEREETALKSDPDPDLVIAGIERLGVFGELNTLVALGEKYGKSPREIEDWTYSLVFGLMLYDKVQNEIKKNYNELKSPKKRG